MKYLDERIYATISGFTAPLDGLYKYQVYQMVNGEDNLLFTGNAFLYANQVTTTIDITDICRNVVYIRTFDPNSEPFYVHLTVGSTIAVSDLVVVYPFYRYPSRKSTDLEINETEQQVCLYGLDSLIPTYPKIKTDNLDIQYYLNNYEDYTIDYGPKINASSDSGLQLLSGSLGQSELASTDIWWDSVTNNDKLISIAPFTWQTIVDDTPTEVTYTKPDGSSVIRTISSFPYSGSLSNSVNVESASPLTASILNADSSVLFEPSVLATGHILTTINTTVEESPTPYYVDPIDGFTNSS